MSEEEILKMLKEYSATNPFKKNMFYVSNLHEAIQGLLDLYNKEKEKNKELEKTILEFVNDRERILKTPVIRKDKIKEFIEKNTKYISFGEQDTYLQGQRDENDEIMDKLQELLEERN